MQNEGKKRKMREYNLKWVKKTRKMGKKWQIDKKQNGISYKRLEVSRIKCEITNLEWMCKQMREEKLYHYYWNA